MMKLFKKMFYSALIILIGLAGFLSFLLTSAPGLYTLIKLSALFLPGSLHIHQISGSASQQFTLGEVDYQINQITIKIKQLTIKGQLLPLLHHKLVVDSLSAHSIEVSQDKTIARFETIEAAGQANNDGLTINTLRFMYAGQFISSNLRINSRPPVTLSGTLKLNPKAETNEVISGVLSIDGAMNDLHWSGDFHGPMTLSLAGSLKEQSQIQQTIKWRDIHWQKSPEVIINSPEGRVNISGTLPDLHITLASKISRSVNDNWRLAARLNGTIPWKWHFDTSLSQPVDPSSKHEGLYTTLSAKGNIEDINKANLLLTLHPGQYEMPHGSIIPTLKFQGGTLKIALSPKELRGNGSFAIDENKKINILFKLPEFQLSQGLTPKQPVSAKLSLLLNSFEFLQDLSPEIRNPKGHLIASLITTGTWGKKVITSSLSLNEGSISLPALGLDLNKIQFIAHATEKKWESEGSVNSENKKLLIKGKGPLNAAAVVGELELEGTDFPIMNTNEYQVRISPKIHLGMNPSGLNITGSLLVPFAQIKPQTFSNSLSVSDDVVFQSKNETPPTPFNTNINLKVEMGNEVELTFKGLHATLAGIVNLTQLPQGPINATGELSVKKGEYKAYGQNLAIEQGQLIFTGGRLDNPGINLRAAKKIDTTTTSTPGTNQPFDFNNNELQNANVRGNISVGVEVSGRLTAPKIVLFSNPAILSQADILSMLVLGRPASQANKAGGQLLLAAISSMNLGGGTSGAQLLEQLKKNLGFDLDLKTTSNYNLATNQISDSTAVVVGKSISKRIYVSYNVGLAQTDPNVLTLKYLLNKFYSIQVSSSTTSSGIDVLYTSSK